MPCLRRPSEEGKEFGYRLRNYFTGEIVADRSFETRSEMEEALAEDLSPESLLGKVFGSLPDGE